MCPLCKPRRNACDPLPHWATDDKHPGWHSRRHQTRDAQDDARERYLSAHGPVARRAKAAR